MKAISKYVADDGTEFHTEEECVAYEQGAATRKLVEEFLESDQNQYKGGPHSTIARRSILAFEQFCLGRQSPTIPDGV